MTTVTVDEFRDAIITWVEDVTGRVPVLANSGQGPQSREKYVVIFISTGVVPTQEDSFLSVDGLTETIVAPTKLDVQLDVYGGDTMQAASRLVRSLKSSDRWTDLWKICGLENVQDFRDLTSLETGVRRQRAQVVIRFNVNLSEDFSSAFFDKFRMEVERDDGEVAASDIKGEEDPHKESSICSI